LEHGGIRRSEGHWLYSDHLEALAVAQIYGERIVEGHLANPEM
jgi:hypothetical protein